jgi:hypothetical protein
LSKRLGLAAACVACVLLAISAIASASAAPPRSVNVSLTGTATWTGAFGSVTAFAIQGTFTDMNQTGKRLPGGSYSGTLTTGTYGPPNDCPFVTEFNQAPVSGTIDLVMNNGTITTEVAPGGLLCSEQIGAHGRGENFDLTLQVTGGTRAYAGASGTLHLSYQSLVILDFFGNPNGPNDTGTLTGALVG